MDLHPQNLAMKLAELLEGVSSLGEERIGMDGLTMQMVMVRSDVLSNLILGGWIQREFWA